MSKFICELKGARGRSITVYDNKCIITTDVSLGSLLTHNALDGRKTIFYVDVVGIQFKKCAFTIGYLQLETASVQMNNMSSNMFSENTFTYDSADAAYDHLVEKIHDYVVDRIESYKYHTTPSSEAQDALVAAAEQVPGCSVEPALLQKLQEDRLLRRQQAEREQAEKCRQEEQARQQAKAEFMQSLQNTDTAGQLAIFLQRALECKRATEVLELWQQFQWPHSNAAVIENKLNEMARVERMYGPSPRSLAKLLEEIRGMV